jgi:outer membrane receptor protein involved in Fe transport
VRYRSAVLCLCCIASGWFASGPVPASAQSSDSETIETKEVVVSSTRLPDTPVDARTLPAKVTIITAEDIKKTGAKTVQEAIQWATGIVMYDSVGNAFQQTIDLRGFNGGPVTGTSVFVDGVRINEPDFNSVNFDLVAVDTVDRIEILPSSSAIFGKNSLGGAINIITKRGADKHQATGETLWGSFGRQRYAINANGPVGKFDYFASFSRESEDGYRRETDASMYRFFGKVGYHPSQETDITASYTYVNNKLFQAGQLTLAEMAQDRRQNPTPGDFFAHENHFVKVNARQRLPFGFSIEANAFYRHLAQDTFGNFGFGFTNATGVHTNSGGTVLQASHQGEWWGIENALVAGAEFTRNEFNAKSNGFISSLSSAKEDIFAFYGQDTIRLTPRLSVVGGVRYDYDRITFDETLNTRPDGTVRYGGVTPRGAVNYAVHPSANLYFSYSHGFRVPTAQEVFAFPPFTSNASLRPARSETYEIGMKGKVFGHTDYSVAVFNTFVRNEIQFTCLICAGGFEGVNRNIGGTRRRGVELTVRTRPIELAAVEANYTYTESIFRQREVFSTTNIADAGDSLPLVPKHRLSVMGHVYPVPGLTLSLIGLYVSTQFAQGDEANVLERIPGYFVLNGRASYETKAPGGTLTAYLLLNNLTDHEYSTFGTASPFGRTFVPAQSLSVYGGLSYRFEGLN